MGFPYPYARSTRARTQGLDGERRFEQAVCDALQCVADAIAQHRLWWRLAVGYLACVFASELASPAMFWAAISIYCASEMIRSQLQ